MQILFYLIIYNSLNINFINETYNDFRLLNALNSDSVLVGCKSIIHASIYKYSFQFLAEAILGIGLLSWCLYLKWDRIETIWKSTINFLVPRILIIVTSITLYDTLLQNDSLSVGISYGALFTQTNYAIIGKFVLIIFLSLIIVSELLSIHLIKYALMLLLFGMLILDTSHLLSLYVCLEALSLISYGLLAAEGTVGNAEAAIKYYLFGSISSALFAYGISIEYLSIHSIDFMFIHFGIITGDFDFITTLYAILTICIVSAYLYKLALFPFHFILPDIYQGISWAVIGLLNIGVKLPIGLHFFYFWNIHFIHPVWIERTSLILLISGLFSVIVGCIGALTQGSLKRFMGYASINQMGFMIIGLGCTNYIGLQASLFYLIVYIWSLLIFSIILHREIANITYLIDLIFGTSVNKSLLTLVIFSMGGLPPFIGFISKYFIWLSLIEEINNTYSSYLTIYNLILIFIVFITMITSVISTFYYLRFIKIMWFVPTRRILQTREVRDLVYENWVVVLFVTFSLLGWPLFLSPLTKLFNFWVDKCYIIDNVMFIL